VSPYRVRLAFSALIALWIPVVSATPSQKSASAAQADPAIDKTTSQSKVAKVAPARGDPNVSTEEKAPNKSAAANKSEAPAKSDSKKAATPAKPKPPANPYSAEYARVSGGEFKVSTKSGTKDIHGNLFGFVRNSALNAKNFFDKPGQPIPPFQRHQFGGSLAGPVVREKTFFFGAFEQLKSYQSQNLLTPVPTAAMVAGDFSELLTQGNPWTQSTKLMIDPLTKQPFPGNIIPADRVNPIGAMIAAHYPGPNRLNDPGRRFISSRKLSITNTYSARMDHQFSKSVKLFGHYSISAVRDLDSSGQVAQPGYGRDDNTRNQNLAIVSSITLNPRTANELRLVFNRSRQRRQLEYNAGAETELGIPGLDLRGNSKLKGGFPLFRVSGFDSIGPNSTNPAQGVTNTFQIVDNLSYNRGSHTIKTGLEMTKAQLFTFQPTITRGTFQFTGRYTGFGLADLLLGLPGQSEREILPEEMRYVENYTYGFYIQDDWKASPQLTLNLGLRYDLETPYTDSHNQIARFDASRSAIEMARLKDPRFDTRGHLPAEMPVPVVMRNSDSLWNADRMNLAPRFALAWKPFKKRPSVIRAGYGIYYDVMMTGSEMSGLATNAPFFFRQTFSATPGTPALTLANPFPESAGTSLLTPVGINLPARPYVQQFTLGLQHELQPNLVLDVGYVGSKGTNLKRSRNINQAVAGPESMESRRPFRGLDRISFREASASSAYHALQVRVEKRLSHGLSFTSTYTYGKSIDDEGSARGAQNEYDWKSEKGLSAADTRNRLVFSHTYKLPSVGKHILKKLPRPIGPMITGWEVSGIFSLASGRPFTPVLSRDNSGTGQSLDRPNIVGSPNLDRKDPARWFNTTAFAIPSVGQFGNAGRNILTGPGATNVDFTLMKNHRFSESRSMQFRAEFYNLLNHPNFLLPNSSVDSSQFGRISTASPSRQVQLALTYTF
jgi:hypothetical protein